MTGEELKAIRVLAIAATPGPWSERDGMLFGCGERYSVFVDDCARRRAQTRITVPAKTADVEFISLSRLMVPRLLDRVDELEKQLGDHADYTRCAMSEAPVSPEALASLKKKFRADGMLLLNDDALDLFKLVEFLQGQVVWISRESGHYESYREGYNAGVRDRSRLPR